MRLDASLIGRPAYNVVTSNSIGNRCSLTTPAASLLAQRAQAAWRGQQAPTPGDRRIRPTGQHFGGTDDIVRVNKPNHAGPGEAIGIASRARKPEDEVLSSPGPRPPNAALHTWGGGWSSPPAIRSMRSR